DEDVQDDDDQDNNDDDQDLDNDGDEFVYPKLSTHDEEAKDEESFDHIVQTPSQAKNSDDESNDDESHDMNVGRDEGTDAEDDDEDEESFDPIVQTPSHVENSNDEGNDDVSHGMNVGGDEGPDAEDDDDELYGDLNINLEGRDIQMTDVHTTQVLEDTHATLTLVNPDGQQQSSSVSYQFVLNMLNLSPDAGIDSLFESTPWEDLEAEVLAQASTSSKTSYVVAADLSGLELKKILIEKMETNKSIY
nr:hypothetical protein [Tanacetum cinerariifolium]